MEYFVHPFTSSVKSIDSMAPFVLESSKGEEKISKSQALPPKYESLEGLFSGSALKQRRYQGTRKISAKMLITFSICNLRGVVCFI